jgi:prepilin-type N-terminal cleavage/methylation domain-containing protein
MPRQGNTTMKQSITRNADRRSAVRQKGFTLVELAVVLAVIGLIIGAVAIGKDVQRNAEYTKVKNKFIDQWEQAYNQYYQRTGVVLGDNQTAPQNMVNGERYLAGGGARSGRNMTAVTPPNAICRAAAGQGMARGFTAGTDPDLRVLMTRVGVRMPPGRAEGLEDRYVYLDSNGNPQEVQVCFQWNVPLANGSAANAIGEGAGNVMVITGLTPDLARSLDQMIDGKPDAREGRFRMQGILNNQAAAGGAAAPVNGPGLEWTVSNRDQIGATNNRSFDEDQVAIVTAIYRMNQ